MGMLKKAASGVPWLCRNGLPGIVVILPCSRTEKYAPRVKKAAALLDELF